MTVLPVNALLSRDTARAVSLTALDARQFGVRFDGVSDDAVPLQRAIDAAARQGQSLILPTGTARLSVPLDLKGRHLGLLGDPAGHTILKAARPLTCLLDAYEEQDVIDSPLYLYGLTLDGSGVTETGLRIRYRHRSVFDTLAVGACRIGVDEMDAWLARRINCRTRGTDVGWRLRGANHSSVWLGCSFTGARIAHLDIGADGTAKDGNDALLFQACDIEFGDGHGILVAPGATASFDTCYLGENIGGDVLRSSGIVSIRGGALFIGHRANRFGIVPLGGTVTVMESSLRGQRYGALDRLVGGAEDTGRITGKAIFRNINAQIKTGGDPFLSGDVLGVMPIRVFAPILGRNWRGSANDVVISEASQQDIRTVQCRTVTGSNPLIGLAAPLANADEARRGGAAYLVIVYSASKPVQLKFTSGPVSRAPSRFIGTLPATKQVGTYVKVDVPIDFASYSTVELIMQAAPGDQLTLHHATISDASMLDPGPLMNLGKAQ